MIRLLASLSLALFVACAGGGGGAGGGGDADAGFGGGDCASWCSGCCTVQGACIEPTTEKRCGSGGETCQDCSLDNGTCSPDGQCECAGCIRPDGTCAPGTADGACGGGGQECTACTEGLICAEGSCQEASECAETCSGCCDDGECIETPSDSQCGLDGAACSDCSASGGMCSDSGICQDPCGPDNCTGCCADAFTCIEAADVDDASCGAGGQACDTCVGDMACVDGACTSDTCANTCDGCCVGETCHEDTAEDDGMCGINGAQCQDCTEDSGICSVGVCISNTCSAQCQGGCCDPNEPDPAAACKGGELDSACGTAGAACVMCADDETCEGGECVIADDSLWNIVIESAEVPLYDDEGDTWDYFGGLPDVYIRVTAGNGTADEVTGETANVSNDISPSYDSEVVHMNVPARAIKENLLFEWRDSETFADSTMASVVATTSTDLFGGLLLVITHPSNPDFKVRFRIVKP